MWFLWRCANECHCMPFLCIESRVYEMVESMANRFQRCIYPLLVCLIFSLLLFFLYFFCLVWPAEHEDLFVVYIVYLCLLLHVVARVLTSRPLSAGCRAIMLQTNTIRFLFSVFVWIFVVGKHASIASPKSWCRTEQDDTREKQKKW